MINIKLIDDSDYNTLLKLYQSYQEVLPTKHGKFISAKLLNDELVVPNAISFGLYKDSVLVGFIIGYISKTTFMSSSMYVDKAYRYYVKSLLDFTETYLKSLNCNSWKALSVTKESNKALKSYGAIPIEIMYYKEI